MTMQALVPLKPFSAAKQRLAGVLSGTERAQLFAAMVEDVLQTLQRHSSIDAIAICSRDRSARWLASHYGIDFIDEDFLGTDNLNDAVNGAAAVLGSRDKGDVLVVHGDLPLLSSDELTRFLHTHRHAGARAITIAPDRRGRGTNLLAWRALPEFRANYGADSFQRHRAQASALGINPAICNLTGAGCDIDDASDLALLIACATKNVARNSVAFLESSGIASRLRATQLGIDTVKCHGDGDHG